MKPQDIKQTKKALNLTQAQCAREFLQYFKGE